MTRPESGPIRLLEPLVAMWSRIPTGRAWLDSMPALIAERLDDWGVRLDGEPFGARVGFVHPVTDAAGARFVLKLNHPDHESEHEPDALRHWAGRGAVRLVRDHAASRALLLERCESGTQLADHAPESDWPHARAKLLPLLWTPLPDEHPFTMLAAATAQWAMDIAAARMNLTDPMDVRVADAALTACHDLGADQGETVLLHQDLHGWNTIRRHNDWVAIDPKPLAGEREFDTASVIRDNVVDLLGASDTAAVLSRRLDILVDRFGFERERMRGWFLAHTMAWSVEQGTVQPNMLAIARHMIAAR